MGGTKNGLSGHKLLGGEREEKTIPTHLEDSYTTPLTFIQQTFAWKVVAMEEIVLYAMHVQCVERMY